MTLCVTDLALCWKQIFVLLCKYSWYCLLYFDDPNTEVRLTSVSPLFGSLACSSLGGHGMTVFRSAGPICSSSFFNQELQANLRANSLVLIAAEPTKTPDHTPANWLSPTEFLFFLVDDVLDSTTLMATGTATFPVRRVGISTSWLPVLPASCLSP